MAKYDPLKQFLLQQTGATITMSFQDVAEIVGGLPSSAYRHQAWWENEAVGSHVQAVAWVAAGWRVDSFSLSRRVVTFRRSMEAG